MFIINKPAYKQSKKYSIYTTCEAQFWQALCTFFFLLSVYQRLNLATILALPDITTVCCRIFGWLQVAYDIMPKSLFIVNTFSFCFRKQFLASSVLLGNFLEKIVLCDEEAAFGSGQAVGYAAMCDILLQGDGMMFNNKVSTLHCTNTDLSGNTSKSLKFLKF